jgi:hypothetical protein
MATPARVGPNSDRSSLRHRLGPASPRNCPKFNFRGISNRWQLPRSHGVMRRARVGFCAKTRRKGGLERRFRTLGKTSSSAGSPTTRSSFAKSKQSQCAQRFHATRSSRYLPLPSGCELADEALPKVPSMPELSEEPRETDCHLRHRGVSRACAVGREPRWQGPKGREIYAYKHEERSAPVSSHGMYRRLCMPRRAPQLPGVPDVL